MGPLLTFKHRIVTENYRKANARLEKIKKQINATNENIKRAIKELKKLRTREIGIKY
jgi:tetrahydromethanopterin S-methyltransferase subunit G